MSKKLEAFGDLDPAEFVEVYSYLRSVAQVELSKRHEAAPWATSIANKALLKLLAGSSFRAKDPEHLRRVGVKAIREVLADALRAKKTKKRGDGQEPLSMEEVGEIPVVQDSAEQIYLVDLMDSIERFRELSPEASRIIEQIHIGGSSGAEAGEELGVTPYAVEAARRLFRDFLRRRGYA
jgi:DNA-directed RNA polymerase specialized sigma24 family protein